MLDNLVKQCKTCYYRSYKVNIRTIKASTIDLLAFLVHEIRIRGNKYMADQNKLKPTVEFWDDGRDIPICELCEWPVLKCGYNDIHEQLKAFQTIDNPNATKRQKQRANKILGERNKELFELRRQQMADALLDILELKREGLNASIKRWEWVT